MILSLFSIYQNFGVCFYDALAGGGVGLDVDCQHGALNVLYGAALRCSDL